MDDRRRSGTDRKGTDFSRNNLDRAGSPYLHQHRENPVHWQEWSPEALEYAEKNGKILFVSSGYSTCHWCHVMAAEAFSDPECAAFLNEHFLSIKIDREERPDIDRYLMGYLAASTGSGGWPLNAFLSPDLKPFFAMTYAAPAPRFGMPGFLDILRQLKRFYEKNRGELAEFSLESGTDGPGTRPEAGIASKDAPRKIDRALAERNDSEFGGLGSHSQKFPPHSSLLYSLSRISDAPFSGEEPSDPGLERFVRQTLDAMSLGGLHDHLQGGFFRYCVDRQWTIPHFEKMLYDQAMLLWVYSLAARIYGNTLYRETAEGILRSLTETFLEDGLFCAAHDADTDHREGETCLWSLEELESVLGEQEFTAFAGEFKLPPNRTSPGELSLEGNFEGKIHLLRKSAGLYRGASLPPAARKACEKLLSVRRRRPQPFLDRKKLTGWNALTGIALLQAYRHLGIGAARNLALELRANLAGRVVSGDGSVSRGILGEAQIPGKFLEDQGALLLFLTYCHEEDREYRDLMLKLSGGLGTFHRDGRWIGAREADFMTVPPERYDLPVPSEQSLAELALARVDMILRRPNREIAFGSPEIEDFRNFAALQTGGYFYLLAGSSEIPWEALPPHSVKVEGTRREFCYRGACTAGVPPGAAQ